MSLQRSKLKQCDKIQRIFSSKSVKRHKAQGNFQQLPMNTTTQSFSPPQMELQKLINETTLTNSCPLLLHNQFLFFIIQIYRVYLIVFRIIFSYGPESIRCIDRHECKHLL